MPIKLFIVEDHHIVREGLKMLLVEDPEIMIAGEASNGLEAMRKVGPLMPDIILMDIAMPVMNGIECTQLIHEQFPAIKILCLSMHDEETFVKDMVHAGANGYVQKNISKEELLFTIKTLYNNVTGGKENNQAVQRFIIHANKEMKLLDYEKDILTLIAQGLTNKEIAKHLSISVRTIETRKMKLLSKTGTHNTANLIRTALIKGWIG